MTQEAAISRLARVALFFAVLFFLVTATHQLRLPGLHYDEAKEAGINAMQLVTGQPVTAFRDATIQIGALNLPLMVQDYIGALNVALAAPFLALGGVNERALRWMPLVLAALTVGMTWLVAYELGGPIAAIVAAFLLAVNPSFVFWSRQGIFVTSVTALLLVATLYFALRWHRDHRTRDVCITAFLLGLGIYAKLLFVWAAIGIAIIALGTWIHDRLAKPNRTADTRTAAKPETPPRAYLAAAVCFLIPLIPLILFNVRTGGTIVSIFGNLGRSYYGVDNTAYLTNLSTRVRQLGTLLRGDHFWYLGEPFGNAFAPWLAAGLLALALVIAPPVWRRRLLAPVALLLLAIAQSAFTVSDLFITHYAMVLPLIPISAGVAAAAIIHKAPTAFTARPPGSKVSLPAALLGIGLVGALALWWTADLWTTARYHDVLRVSGGYAGHSDAIYDLAEYLDQFEPAAPLALDWGLDSPVRFLTQGRVNPIEAFGYDSLDMPDPGFESRVSPFLDDARTLYLAHAPDATVFQGRVEALATLAQTRGLTLEETARFAERNGRLLFIVYQAVPPAPSE